MVIKFLAAATIVSFIAAPAAMAQRTKFDALRQCEHRAAVQFKRHDPQFRRFMIDRATIEENKYADQVGTQFVSTIYLGKATYEGGAGPKAVRFICLHGGYRRGALFVYTISE
jgi:putative N-acetylmannosamine-6-phosphate epimerase